MSRNALVSLFDHKAFANAELFALVAMLPPELAEHCHACVRLLNHVYVVDRIFRAHLDGEPRPFDATNTPDTPALARLATDVEATDGWYQRHVAALTPAELTATVAFTFTDGGRGRMSREEMLLHVVTHGAYHRGNVGQILKSVGVAPPRDLYTRFLHESEPTRRSA